MLNLTGLVLAIVLAAVGRLPLLPLLKRLAAANFFILFLWVTVPFSVPGESWITLGPLNISGEGIALAFSVTVRCNAILLCFLVLVADLDISLIGDALKQLRIPVKLVFLFLFTCRYIHVIRDEWQRLQTAASLRSFVPRTSLHTYRTFGNMLGLTVINSLDRAKRIHEAMLLRGFNGTFHMVSDPKTTRGDVVFTAVFFAFLSSLLFFDIYLRFSHA